jgi:hypothetical protein
MRYILIIVQKYRGIKIYKWVSHLAEKTELLLTNIGYISNLFDKLHNDIYNYSNLLSLGK